MWECVGGRWVMWTRVEAETSDRMVLETLS